jgi:preprotein translocase subunit SecA
MDHLKEGIGLRGYGQKDPLVEYKKESFHLFNALMDRIEDDSVRYLFFLQTSAEPGFASAQRPVLPFNPDDDGFDDDDDSSAEREAVAVAQAQAQRAAAQSSMQDFTRNIVRKKEREMEQLQFVGGDSSTTAKAPVRNAKVGRNDPCPCGSGKKYKKCCGA